MDAFLLDLRRGVRRLLRQPAFTVGAALILALGIGATSAVFTVTRALLVQPALAWGPRVVIVWGTNRAGGQPRDVISGPTFLDLQRENRTLTGLAAIHFSDLTLRESEGAGVVSALEATPDFFAVTGVHPMLGRGFEPTDADSGSDVLILSHGFWQRRFGGDRAVIGQTLDSVGHRYQIVGVLPPAFRFFEVPDVVTLLRPRQLAAEERTHYHYWLAGRLKDGTSVAEAERDLDGIMSRLASSYASLRGWDVTTEPMSDVVAEPIRPATHLALATVLLVLLVACANVANLLLTRNVNRRRELAIRVSLGASRARLFRELLLEAGWLSAAGGALGILLSVAGVAALNQVMPAAVAVGGAAATISLPLLAVDRAVLVFATAVSALTAALCGAIPAWRACRQDASGAFAPTARGVTHGPLEQRLRAWLVSTEMALTTVLLVVASLLLQTIARLSSIDPGFRADGVLTMIVGRVDDLAPDARERYYREVLRRVADVPGVIVSSLNDYVLLTNEDDYEGFEIEGRPRLASGGWPREEWRRVSADYFRTLSIPTVRGRAFTRGDTAAAPSVVIVNEAMARKYWPGADPLGRRIRITAGAYGWSEIVGIVGDVREVGLDQPAKPMMFVPYHRSARPVMALFARVGGDPDRMIQPIRRAIWSLDATRPVFSVRRLDRLVSDSMAVRRLAERVSGFTATLALLLTVVGIYATLSHGVSQRRREIGVRVAIGARSYHVVQLVLLQGAVPTVAGLGLGLVGAFSVASLARNQLYGISAFDPATYAGAAAALTLAAAGACCVPAFRAARVDPVTALQAE